MTLTDWNKSPIYRDELDSFLKTPTGTALISVLREITPKPPRQAGLDAQFLLIEQGRTLNHLDVIDTLQAMRHELQKTDQVTPDYAPENND